MEKQVNKLHLIYGYAISGLLILSIVVCWILSCQGLVSENAFQNFSFAASVVSIVLAVVSIVFTIYSGAGVSNSIDILQEAERKIESQVNALNGLETRIVETVEKGNSGLADKITEVQTQMEPLFLLNQGIDKKKQARQTDKEIIDILHNSTYGNLLLYICIRSIETKKSWPFDILGNENKSYFKGFIVALASIPVVKFSYNTDENFEVVLSCEFAELNIDQVKREIVKEIKDRVSEKRANELFTSIEEHFAK